MEEAEEGKTRKIDFSATTTASRAPRGADGRVRQCVVCSLCDWLGFQTAATAAAQASVPRFCSSFLHERTTQD